MSISSVSSNSSLYQYYSSRSLKNDTSEVVDKLFSQLDTKGQGYLEVSDLENAFSQLDSGSDSGVSAEQVFSSLDQDGDGKITKDEMSSNLEKLAEDLNSQFDAMRVASGMPPPPPPAEANSEEDEGYTAEELATIASSTEDSNLATLMSSLAANFEDADTDGDGKVNRQEAMAYQEATGTGETSGPGPMAGMPPPPPPAAGGSVEDEGYTAEELSSIASSTEDSNLATLMNSLAANFDAADTNGDGKVSSQEARAYQEASSADKAGGTSSTDSTSEAAIMRRIMDLVQAYGSSSDTASGLSVSA
ncbi:EF-hand domain-containing protein [Azovibrio restrictus]|uniref:EF-hand domain-containing protein n=1 Tax=Azovibrio restrictus TaxID=146938 RepID=UPI0026F2312D|nr:EF-hand domain-containing protein [Azovibrio restrictus]MDD3482965.1 EF-hand domain-containing protein [Azovibrio restrictus]